MKKKKILVDARCIGGEGQGMLTYIVGLYNAMFNNFNAFYEIYFAGYSFGELKHHFPGLEKSHFICLPNESKLKLFTKTFPRIIADHNFDFAHFQYVTPFIKRCKQIVTTHDVLFLDFPSDFSWSYRIKRKFLFYISLLRSEIRLTVSNYSRHRIAQHFSLNLASINITPNAISNKFLVSYDKEEVSSLIQKKYGIGKYILYVSRIEKRKNQIELLKAFQNQNLGEQGYHLVFVGNNTLEDSDFPNKFKKLQLPFPNQLHWFQNLSEDDLIQLYQGATIFVYPSKAEGFGIPPIEATALGINTLCASNTAMKDFSFLKENLYNDQRSEELPKLLSENLINPPNPDRLKTLAQTVKERYSWSTAAKILHTSLAKY